MTPIERAAEWIKTTAGYVEFHANLDEADGKDGSALQGIECSDKLMAIRDLLIAYGGSKAISLIMAEERLTAAFAEEKQ